MGRQSGAWNPKTRPLRDKLKNAQRAVERAGERRDWAVRQALANGVGVRHVADVLGVDKSTVSRRYSGVSATDDEWAQLQSETQAEAEERATKEASVYCDGDRFADQVAYMTVRDGKITDFGTSDCTGGAAGRDPETSDRTLRAYPAIKDAVAAGEPSVIHDGRCYTFRFLG